MLKILVVGTGYVGLVSGTCFADLGHKVTCIDNDVKKIEGLNSGTKVPIYEKGLNKLIDRNRDNGRLNFACELSEYINDVDVVIIAVGTPLNDQGRTNFTYINQCVEQIIKEAKKDLYIIIKSTVPVGTCDVIQDKFTKDSSYSLQVISNPEFLREGEAVYDFLHPDRIVVGSNLKDVSIIDELYSKYKEKNIEIVYTNRVTAELIKYASNSFLAAKVAFINEMADLSEALGGDISKVSYGMGLDRRIGKDFLKAGPGFGGSCFPKDVRALFNIAKDKEIKVPLLHSIEESNVNRQDVIVHKIENIVEPKGKIAVLGLTYKAGTDDVRCSPSIHILRGLHEKGFALQVHDPQGIDKASSELGDQVMYCDNLYSAVDGVSLCIIMTDWDEYKNIDPQALGKRMQKRQVYDLRRVIDRQRFSDAGFYVKVVGYKSE